MYCPICKTGMTPMIVTWFCPKEHEHPVEGIPLFKQGRHWDAYLLEEEPSSDVVRSLPRRYSHCWEISRMKLDRLKGKEIPALDSEGDDAFSPISTLDAGSLHAALVDGWVFLLFRRRAVR